MPYSCYHGERKVEMLANFPNQIVVVKARQGLPGLQRGLLTFDSFRNRVYNSSRRYMLSERSVAALCAFSFHSLGLFPEITEL